jgi:OmpA-OmpF porin, OOP family
MTKFIALALLAFSTAHAQDALTDIRAKTPSSGYLQDSRGTVARSGSGMCWRSGSWTPADAVPGCDGALVSPVVNPIAPPLATPSAPAPIAMPLPQKRCDFSYTVGGDEAFTFGRASLKAAARQKLERELVPRFGECSTLEAVVITGHTDRLGSERSNQKLSEQRAAAVASYLKGKGVAASIETIGAGKNQPLALCNGRLPPARLRTCLAPNRRVVVDVRGTSN